MISKSIRRVIALIIIVSFSSTTLRSPALAQITPSSTSDLQSKEQGILPFLPRPGVMVHLSPAFVPANLKGMIIHPENALKFDFIIDRGQENFSYAQKKEEYAKLIKYFLASLAIPDGDQWVNLSPYEKDRIIKNDFGKTEMGRDLLAQDYLLKQITASLIYPEDSLGKEFWSKVYSDAQKEYGTTNVPVNTFNKVWIVPDLAELYEKGHAVFLIKSHLKVMLEEDYLALQKHQRQTGDMRTHSTTSQIVRELVLPALEKEVNEGANFAPLRQAYSGMILAAWYKRALRNSLLARIYANKKRTKGLGGDSLGDRVPGIDQIYRQYLKAYRKGVFNFIKEDVDKYTNESIPRKYFSGGVSPFNYDKSAAMLSDQIGAPLMQKILSGNTDRVAIALVENTKGNKTDAAMGNRYRPWEGNDHLKLALWNLVIRDTELKTGAWENGSQVQNILYILSQLSQQELRALYLNVFYKNPLSGEFLKYLFSTPVIFGFTSAMAAKGDFEQVKISYAKIVDFNMTLFEDELKIRGFTDIQARYIARKMMDVGPEAIEESYANEQMGIIKKVFKAAKENSDSLSYQKEFMIGQLRAAGFTNAHFAVSQFLFAQTKDPKTILYIEELKERINSAYEAAIKKSQLSKLSEEIVRASIIWKENESLLS